MVNIHTGVSISAWQKNTLVKNDDTQVKQQVTLTAGEQVTIRGGQDLEASEDTDKVEAYQAVGKDARGLNPYAKTIVSFIQGQLQRDVADGATEEQLQSRLQAGLDGFLTGFNEAFGQLKDSGLLSEAVSEAIGQTRTQVMAELEKMAEAMGVEAPMPTEALKDLSGSPAETSGNEPSAEIEEPSAVFKAPSAEIKEPSAIYEQPSASVVSDASKSPPATSHQPSITDPSEAKNQLNAQVVQGFSASMAKFEDTYEHLGKTKPHLGAQVSSALSRSLSFDLTTQEGDKVSIRFDAKDAFVARAGSQGEGVAGKSGYAFSFEVVGALDEGELDAINALLEDVQALSQTFYEGDIGRAFEMALSLDYDDSEIAAYALELTRVSLERVELNPQTPDSGLEQTQGNAPATINEPAGAGAFAEQIQRLIERAESRNQNLELLQSVLGALNDFEGQIDRANGASDQSKPGLSFSVISLELVVAYKTLAGPGSAKPSNS